MQKVIILVSILALTALSGCTSINKNENTGNQTKQTDIPASNQQNTDQANSPQINEIQENNPDTAATSTEAEPAAAMNDKELAAARLKMVMDSYEASSTIKLTIKLGGTEENRFLTDINGMSLYTYKKDQPKLSNCIDDCEKKWPPLTWGGFPSLGPGLSGSAGLMLRKGGNTQVVFNNAPLYLYSGDTARGETRGDGVNGEWTLARP
jgi:predicted lipoprotein with Yx(FWY)xxD motif